MKCFFHLLRKCVHYRIVLVAIPAVFLLHPLSAQETTESVADSSISGIINTYTPVLSISGGCSPIIEVASSNGFAQGDKVLIIQMQGAEIDGSNSSNYGQIINYNGAGNYEFGRIALIKNNSIYLRNSLLRTYTIAGKVQLIRVPEYQSATVTNQLTGQPWNGSTGGVIALNVASLLTLNAPISATGLGFRGGVAVNAETVPPNHTTDFYNLSSLPGNGGAKGEGIAGYGNFPNINGKGAPANGGGGGNNHNAGGGGGANLGAGGTGGYGWASIYTGDRFQSLGLGGYNLDNTQQKLFMGGGGGAGHINQNDQSSGGNGGGIIIIIADEISSTPMYPIASDGNQGGDALPDGAGGGGGGGSIVLAVNKYKGIVSISANGGRGGNNVYTGGGIAPGGGGGGGGVYLSLPTTPNILTCSVAGGVSGLITADKTTFGASAGKDGSISYSIIVPESSKTGTSGITDAGPDLSICLNEKATIGSTALPGYTYSWSPQTGLSNPTSAQPTAQPLKTTDYIITSTSPTGCVSSDTVRVVVNPLVPLQFTLTPDTVEFVPNEKFQTELRIPGGVQQWNIRLLYNTRIMRFDTILSRSAGIQLPLPIDQNTGQLKLQGTGGNGTAVLQFKTYLPNTNDSVFAVQIAIDSTKNSIPCGRPFSTDITIKTGDYCGRNFRYVSGTGNTYFLSAANHEIQFGVGLSGNVRLEVFDYMGRSLQTLADTRFEAGNYSATIDVPTGLYFCRMSAGVFEKAVKMVVVK